MPDHFSSTSPASFHVEEETAFSMDVILTILRRYWYAMILAALIGGSIAYYLAGRQNYVYQKKASVMMRDSKASKDDSSERIMTELGIDPGTANLANESFILKSTALMKKVVEDLDLNTSYWKKEDFREIDIYQVSPVLVVFEQIDGHRSCNLSIKLVDDNRFTLVYPDSRGEVVTLDGRFGNPVTLPFAVVTVQPTSLMSKSWIGETVVVRRSPSLAAAHGLLSGLTVSRPDAKDSSLLEMTLTSTNPQKAVEVLNHLIEVYNQLSKDEKSQSARKTQTFIKGQLKELRGALGEVDRKIAEFKAEGNIVKDTETVMVADFGSAQALDKEIFDLETQIKLAATLAGTLQSTGSKSGLISVDTGLTDFGISRQIENYNEAYLEYQKIAGSAGVKNPIAVSLRDKMNSTRVAVNKALENYRSNQEIKLKELINKKNTLTVRLSETASKEQALAPLIWEHKVKEELYLMLLSKDLENSLSLAIAEPSARVHETAYGSDAPISPKTTQFIVAGTAGGAALCLFMFVGIGMLNNKVKNKHDLIALSPQPVVAELPVMNKRERKHPSLFIQDDRSVMSECFHILRNNVDTLLPKSEKGAYVIMVTSTMAGEGKTMTSSNLAAAFARAGRKVLLIDGDLRKASLSRQLGGKGRKGFTSILLNQIEDPASAIHPLENAPDGISILYAGSIVPNPVTLLSRPLLGRLLDYLRTQYDAVIIDAPPYGILADTAILGACADITLYVVRSGQIDRRYFANVQQLADMGKLNNLAYVINAVDFKAASYSHYGYGYGYQYGYGLKDNEKNEK